MPALVSATSPYPTYAQNAPSAGIPSGRTTFAGVPSNGGDATMYGAPAAPKNRQLMNGGQPSKSNHITIILIGIAAFLLLRSL